MQLIKYAIILINHLFQATAWHISPAIKIHRWHLLVGSIHKSSSLFLATESEECSATPKIKNSAGTTMNDSFATINTLMRKPKEGDIVTFTLHRFKPTKGEAIDPPFDTSGTLQLMLHRGHYIPSLHSLLATMNPGENVKSSIIDAGYGPYRPELKITIPTSQIGDVDTSLVKIGTRLAFGETECRTTSITDEEWICDANHALAGSEYEVDVTLESVEQGVQHWGFVEDEMRDVNGRYRVATFALGCFWGGGV